MPIEFNADEVLELAEEIERNAGRFYRQAAAKSPLKDIQQMFLDMAAMEDDHLQIFQQMRADLDESEREPTVFDPDNEAVLYLQALAGSKGSEGMKGPTVKFTGEESVGEVLEAAIQAEKYSVLFYVGLRDLVPTKPGRDKLEKVIREEVRHVALLNKRLGELS